MSSAHLRVPRLSRAASGLAVVAAWVSITAAVRAEELAEPPIVGDDADSEYLRQLHRRLHGSWVDGYIRVTAYDRLGPATSKRETEVSLTIRWDGTVESVEVSKPSDAREFDAAAMNAIWMSAPFPPPTSVMADDGLAHLKWRFARDFRQCAGGEVVHVEFPLATALPNLMARGLLSESLRRMSKELDRGGWVNGDFLAPFARGWLARPNLSDQLDTQAAAALVTGGDHAKLDRLKGALLGPTTAAIAAPTLQAAGINVGKLLTAALSANGSDSARAAAVAALRAVPAIAHDCVPCIHALAAAALDPRHPAAERIAMLRTLGTLEGTPVVRMALSAASKDTNPAVRGAAMLASITPEHDRAALFRMSPLLHDPSPDIRAAAAAGVLRAAGDQGIEQLYLLARERDPRPMVAAAAELARLRSEESATLLGKWLSRSDKTVRRAAIQALVDRHDETARALVAPVLAAALMNRDEDVAVRELALRTATPEQLSVLATDPRLGRAAYRAMLAANRREEAARWLVNNLDQLMPDARIAVLGEWIAEAPKAPRPMASAR